MNQVARLEPDNLPAALTPMDMIERAVSSGANIDTIEKLMGLQERWEKNQARKAFDAAVADAKAEIKPVARTATGHNSKRYADFASIARAVDPILSQHGLSYRFRSEQNDKINVTCILSHKLGHSEETTLSGPPDNTGNKNAIQAIGSTLTYLQRYSLMQALGLAASNDDDGRAETPTGPITDAQVEALTKLIRDTKSDINKFLTWARAESLSDIPQSKFAEAMAMLEAKKGAAK